MHTDTPAFSWRVNADAALPDVAPPGLADEVARAFRADGGLPDVTIVGGALHLQVHARGRTKDDAEHAVAQGLAAVLRDLGQGEVHVRASVVL